MDLPTTHRVPITWLTMHACAPIKYRAIRDVMPEGWASKEDLANLAEEVSQYRTVSQIAKKQKPTGVWSSKMLAPGTTVDQYRRLVELGVPGDARALQITNRVFYRLISRDPDPNLYFEFKKEAKSDPAYASWMRELLREAATAALVEARQNRDPRVRGAAIRTINGVSDFLRNDYTAGPFIKAGSKTILIPDANPPTLYSVAMIAHMPTLQRERAGFVERLADFVTQPNQNKTYWIRAGNQTFKSDAPLLGDPLLLDAKGRPKDLPFALHWLELLARLGVLESSDTACQALSWFLGECTDEGVWSPRVLRTIPTSPSGRGDFLFPLETDTKTSERRRTDTTFRLALIARHAGMELEFI